VRCKREFIVIETGKKKRIILLGGAVNGEENWYKNRAAKIPPRRVYAY
jgi:hypothetical protein